MSQIMEIVSQSSPTKNLGEYSDTQALHAHFCPNIHPIYQQQHADKVAISAARPARTVKPKLVES